MAYACRSLHVHAFLIDNFKFLKRTFEYLFYEFHVQFKHWCSCGQISQNSLKNSWQIETCDSHYMIDIN